MRPSDTFCFLLIVCAAQKLEPYDESSTLFSCSLYSNVRLPAYPDATSFTCLWLRSKMMQLRACIFDYLIIFQTITEKCP